MNDPCETPPRGTNGSMNDQYKTPPQRDSSYISSNPDLTWKNIKSCQKFEPLNIVTTNEYDPSTHTRVVFMSDTHGRHRKVHVPPGDILIHGGDFTAFGEQSSVADLSKFFEEQKRSGNFKHIICIAGNHELTFDEEHYNKTYKMFHHEKKDCSKARNALENCVYLQDESYQACGLNFYGSPWQPVFCDWAFNLPRGIECREKWSCIPSSTDVLITHGPPLGRGDQIKNGGRVGCVDLLYEVQQRIKPLIHVFGHIHEDYGVSSDGTTVFVNASNMSASYRIQNPVITIDIPHDRTKPAVIVTPQRDI